MALIHNVASAQGEACGYFAITDITTFSAPSERLDYGWAVYWEKDLIFIDGDLNNDGTDALLGTINIQQIGNGTYKVANYFVPQWNIAENYIAGDIVCDFVNDNKFYLCAAPVTGGLRPELNSTDWTLLTTDITSYGFFSAATNITEIIVSEIVDCPAYNITKSACHQYTITDNSGLGGDKKVNLYDYNDTLLSTTTLVEALSSSIDLSSFGDGVYYIDVVDANDVSLGFTYPIYEWCSLRACIEILIRNVISKCDDPCAQECDVDCQLQTTIYRNELNKTIALYFPMIGIINADLLGYVGIFSIDEVRQATLNQIGQMIAQLKVITGRCGDCDSTTTNLSGTNTQNCNC